MGLVGRPHGLNGAFVVEKASDDPERFAIGSQLYVDGSPGSEAAEWGCGCGPGSGPTGASGGSSSGS